MRARWVSPRPAPELPIVGQAIVATWLPGRYYFVSTIQLDLTDPIRRFDRKNLGAAANRGFPYERLSVQQGWMWADNSPLYERRYETLEEAEAGHVQTLSLLPCSRHMRGIRGSCNCGADFDRNRVCRDIKRVEATLREPIIYSTAIPLGFLDLS
jgi:hypothetical protein